jgi:hypothetical protein
MKHFIIVLFLGLLLPCSTYSKFVPKKIDLQAKWDTVRPLANPDKGWYHHMLDNGINKYLIQNETDLTSFPGMDHLYLRLCWAFLEPEEGKYNWAVIDTIIDKYVPLGYGISFRISCKETGKTPGSVPEEINGVYYATPSWVQKAGAKGIVPDKFGPPVWTPVWDDPVFLEKLDNFHRAFAAKYDGQPWVRYIDVGSIGDWGEGHTHPSTRIPPTVAQVKANMDIYLKNYKKSQLVVTDDLLYWNKSKEDVTELYDYAVSHGFTLRDDSPMVKFYIENNLKTWSVSHPHFYDPLYFKKPIVFESEHYKSVKGNGLWLGKNGKDIIPTVGFSGAMIFKKAMELEHATYIGFHGYLSDWLKDNPDLTIELLNRCGYWYFPKSIQITSLKDSQLFFEIEWLNRGIAPAYSTYQLKGKLSKEGTTKKAIEFMVEDSGNKNWMPGVVYLQKYSIKLNEKPAGKYQLTIQLFDKKSGRQVEIGLNANANQNGYYVVQNIGF